MTARLPEHAGEALHQPGIPESANKFLAFRVGKDTYAVNILQVREIIEYQQTTPIPMMPDFISGAINLRGHVIPVIALHTRLARAPAQDSPRRCIIIVEYDDGGEDMEVGLIVDGVSTVRDIQPDAIDPPPSFGGRVRADFIHGMGRMEDGRLMVLLDLNRILSMEDLQVLAQTRDQAERLEADRLDAAGDEDFAASDPAAPASSAE